MNTYHSLNNNLHRQWYASFEKYLYHKRKQYLPYILYSTFGSIHDNVDINNIANRAKKCICRFYYLNM